MEDEDKSHISIKVIQRLATDSICHKKMKRLSLAVMAGLKANRVNASVYSLREKKLIFMLYQKLKSKKAGTIPSKHNLK